MCTGDEWEEKCNLCGRMVGRSTSPFVVRVCKDGWSYCETWEELLMICDNCFADIFLAGARLRGGMDAKVSGKAE